MGSRESIDHGVAPMEITWPFDCDIDLRTLRSPYPKSKQRIPVWDDLTVLESLEDAETGDIDRSRAPC